MRNYIFAAWHGFFHFVQMNGVKFQDSAPYADGTPQYELAIAPGVWHDLVTDPAGGWRLSTFDNGKVAINAQVHTITLRDGNGEHKIATFDLLSSGQCLDVEGVVYDAVNEIFTMFTEPPETFQEYSIDGGADTLINNDPFQVFDFDILPESFSLNWIKTGGGACSGPTQIFYNEQAAPPVSEVSPGQIGVKIPWQFWIPLDDAPEDFFDATKPNDGKNLNSSNYSEKQGFEIRAAIRARVRKDGIDTIYEHRSPKLLAQDFRTEPGVVDNWGLCTIETFNASGNSLGGGLLLNGEVTTIKATFTPQAPIIASAFFGVIRLQETEQPGFDIWESSSIDRIAQNSPLALCAVSEDSGNLVVTCDTVPANLGVGPYTLSAKVDLGPVVETGDDYLLLDYSNADYL